MLSEKTRVRFKNNPAEGITEEIKDFVRTCPANRLPFLNDYIRL